MTNLEIQKNQRALEHATAQQMLEGLTIPPEAAIDLRRIALGKMTTTDALCATHNRFTQTLKYV